MNVVEIMAILPHRYPFLMVDRLLSLEPGVKGVGVKNVTANEPQFMGHYPGRPIFPGVLVLEAMAQVGGLIFYSPDNNHDRVPVLAAVDGARFRRLVVPGDQLVITVETVKAKGGIVKCRGTAAVDGQLVAEAELMFASVPAAMKE